MVIHLAIPISRGAQKCFSRLPLHRARFWVVFVLLVLAFDPLLLHVANVEALYFYGLPLLVVIEITYASTVEHCRLDDPWAIATALLFVLGYGGWTLGQRNYCVETGWFQFHALWHVCCAASTLTMYRMLANDVWVDENDGDDDEQEQQYDYPPTSSSRSMRFSLPLRIRSLERAR